MSSPVAVASPFCSSSSSSSISFTKCRSSSPPALGGFSSGFISYYKINYQEIKKLGRGAGGDATLCRNNIDEDLYAIKKIRTRVSEAARLKEEAVILRHLEHPNIVRYYQSWIEDTPINEPFDIFDDDEFSRSVATSNGDESDLVLFIAMEYCPQTLRKAINRGLSDVNNLFYQLVKGVHYIHSKGMMHRDLNPNNVFLNNAGNIKIGDFGCSTKLSGNDFCSEVGTSYYRAPELDSGSEYDERIDIYSLGMIFFEMLYRMDTQMERHEVLTALRGGVFPVNFEANFPVEAQFISKMLERDPDERMNMKTLLSALKRKKSGSW